MVGTLYTIFADIDTAITGFLTLVVGGIAGYIAPIVFVAVGVWLLSWSILMIMGKVQSPAGDLVVRILVVGFVLWLMQSPIYLQLIVAPAQALPNELIAAASGNNNPQNIMEALWSNIFSFMLSGLSQAGTQFSTGLLSSAIIILLFTVATTAIGACLIGLSMFLIGYTKIGMGLVLAMGPLALAFAIWPATRNYFYAWLNTVLYFAVLAFLTALFVMFFVDIPNRFIQRISATTPSTNVVDRFINFFAITPEAIQISVMMMIVMGIMFFLMLQLPTIAQSITQGSGGSGAGGLSSVFHMARSLGGKPNAGGAASSGGGGSPPAATNAAPSGGGR
jgi:type IV secretion system protein VirB6